MHSSTPCRRHTQRSARAEPPCRSHPGSGSPRRTVRLARDAAVADQAQPARRAAAATRVHPGAALDPSTGSHRHATFGACGRRPAPAHNRRAAEACPPVSLGRGLRDGREPGHEIRVGRHSASVIERDGRQPTRPAWRSPAGRHVPPAVWSGWHHSPSTCRADRLGVHDNAPAAAEQRPDAVWMVREPGHGAPTAMVPARCAALLRCAATRRLCQRGSGPHRAGGLGPRSQGPARRPAGLVAR